MFEKLVFNSYKKRIGPYLAPEEELLSATPVESSGMMKGYLLGGELGLQIRAARRDRETTRESSGTNEGGVELASANMVLAITSRRLLIFKFGKGRSANPKDLLTNVPIGDVDSIEVGRQARLSKPLTLTVRGERFELEVRRAVNTDTLLSAFTQARSSMTVPVS